MTSALQKAIEESREREKKALPLTLHLPRNKKGDHIEGCLRWEPRFREALALLLDEVVSLAPTKCECTVKWICPRCLTDAALTRIEAILRGDK